MRRRVIRSAIRADVRASAVQEVMADVFYRNVITAGERYSRSRVDENDFHYVATRRFFHEVSFYEFAQRKPVVVFFYGNAIFRVVVLDEASEQNAFEFSHRGRRAQFKVCVSFAADLARSDNVERFFSDRLRFGNNLADRRGVVLYGKDKSCRSAFSARFVNILFRFRFIVRPRKRCRKRVIRNSVFGEGKRRRFSYSERGFRGNRILPLVPVKGNGNRAYRSNRFGYGHRFNAQQFTLSANAAYFRHSTVNRRAVFFLLRCKRFRIVRRFFGLSASYAGMRSVFVGFIVAIVMLCEYVII